MIGIRSVFRTESLTIIPTCPMSRNTITSTSSRDPIFRAWVHYTVHNRSYQRCDPQYQRHITWCLDTSCLTSHGRLLETRMMWPITCSLSLSRSQKNTEIPDPLSSTYRISTCLPLRQIFHVDNRKPDFNVVNSSLTDRNKHGPKLKLQKPPVFKSQIYKRLKQHSWPMGKTPSTVQAPLIAG